MKAKTGRPSCDRMRRDSTTMTNSKPRPNVVLIVVDQMRADALGINQGPDFLSTPTLDMMASQGYNFVNAYSPVPSCVPARAALLTGLDQANSGRVGYEDQMPWNFTQTLPQTFRDAGYQTQCIGKMHVYPARKRLGFDHVTLHDGYLHVDRHYDGAYGASFEQSSDYLKFLKAQLGPQADLMDDGLNCNSWMARPWPYAEALHPTNWLVTEAIEFLKTKDPTVPFFLKLSFEKPHSPFNPPQYYFDMYYQLLGQEWDRHLGDWEQLVDAVPSIDSKKGCLKPDDQRRLLAGYYGLVTHLDHQISRFLTALEEFGHAQDTLFWFVSDHGDQLGEHDLFRKGYPYQGSIQIPSFIYDPGHLLAAHHHTIPQLVKIQDIFPSLVDLVLGQQVATDGRSVRQLLLGQIDGWRTDIHGEHVLGQDSSQFVLNERYKLIWYPVQDRYQLFDYVADPYEQVNLYDQDDYAPVVLELTQKLVAYLANREEGFVEDGRLVARPLSALVTTLAAARRGDVMGYPRQEV